MVVAVVVLIWSAAFVQRNHGGMVLLLLMILLFLVGGGFYTLWFGIVAGIAGAKIGAPLPWWRAHLPTGTARVMVRLWPWILRRSSNGKTAVSLTRVRRSLRGWASRPHTSHANPDVPAFGAV
jgi:hypothetical protein